MYLSSYRINNAEESAVDYRVQLQRNVDEERGKYLPSLQVNIAPESVKYTSGNIHLCICETLFCYE